MKSFRRVFEYKVVRNLFEAKINEIIGEWRKLHNTELHALFSLPTIIRNLKSRLRWVGHIARMVQSRYAYRVLVEKPEGKRSLRRLRCTLEDNIKMYLKEVGHVHGDLIALAEDRDQSQAYVRAVMNLRAPQNIIS